MNNYKIKVNNEAESKEAQELFFELGYQWYKEDKGVFWETTTGFIFANGRTKILMGGVLIDVDTYTSITLPQLRDIVVLHRDDVRDATHTDQDNWKWFISSSGIGYVFGCGNSQNLPRWDESPLDMVDLIPIAKQIIKEPEQGLISGADALKAMMEGKRVLYSGYKNQDWDTALNCNLGVFLKHEKFPDFSFKIVPRTIKLEIEIPAPFEPKVGEIYYFITTSNSQGFDFTEFEDSDGDKLYMQLGAYRNASDASKAFEALRGGIKQ